MADFFRQPTGQSSGNRIQNVLRAGGISPNRLSPNLRAKIALLESRMPAIIQQAAREATRRAVVLTQRLVTQAFESERYYAPGARGGVLRALKRNTASYDRYKRKRGFDRRRGHREGNLQAAIDSMVSETATGFGIALDLQSAAAASGAGEYAAHYEEQKAPGLGSPRAIPRIVFREWERYMKRRVHTKAAGVLRSVKSPELIPVLLSDRQLAAWIGRVGVRLKVG